MKCDNCYHSFHSALSDIKRGYWCPHCKKIKPEWEKLEKDNTLKNIVIDRVNCEEDEKAAEKNNIEGFPTILFSKNGKVESYEGGREYGDFKKFLKSKI